MQFVRAGLRRCCTVGLIAGSGLAAEPLKSPLNTTPDPLGAELQRSFISAPAEIAASARGTFVAYRKTFRLDAVPRSARLHLFADARYLLWLNGRPLQRGPNRFEIRGPEYDSIDLSTALRPGANTLVVLVMGNGGPVKMVNDGMGQGHNARMMSHDPGLTLRADIDGHTVLRSDESWRWSDRTRYLPAKIDWAKIVDRIDARIEDGDWTQPDYDDRAWRSAVKIDGAAWGPLAASRIPPLRDTPVEGGVTDHAGFPLVLTAGGQVKFSTGGLVLAYTELALDADDGTVLSLDYAGIDYTAKAGRQTYVSSDTCAFDGGTISVKSGRATLLGFKLVERRYPFDRIGHFRSSDPLLDRVWQVGARSLEILSEDSYTDCADRERAEWMDNDPPAFDVTRSVFAGPGADGRPAYADARLFGSMLRRTALTQQRDGWVKAHTASDRFDIHAHMEDRSCDWVQGTRRYLDSTGDATTVREIWPVIVGQLDYLLSRRTARGLVLAREWVVWGNPTGYVTCEGAGINAFVFKALVDATHLGRALGESREADRFAREAVALAAAFNTVLWNEDAGTYFSGYLSDHDRPLKLRVERHLIEPTMFPALWALDQGIVPADRRARVTDFLLRHREQAARTMTFYYLFKQLYAADTAALDREVLATIRTKWKPQADSPWGTSWEDLDGASKAHIYGLHPTYFLSAYVLGVRAEMPASRRHVFIEPRLGDLTFAEGVVVTEFGPVPVSWRATPTGLTFRLEVPEGVTATLRLPKPAVHAVLVIDGTSCKARPEGRYLCFDVGAGNHSGVVACRFTNSAE